ncbi:hypothetical protein QKT49_gp137 [Acanthamoeba castellanii medusavirus]|uniref:Uncharacterized protein n=1 Tax=Acanthamoeba castellanii medusavirus J1 TaxID=3114988 RepID=A0A3T1CWR4_9VIRU|nr:hypothetical protein QKT49_gp137 [Acanthamoeba castellanii medusavirus]BBI30277.1 hypothetical protein [Acanthamoeba castellanii medusavirus J1]
MHEKDAPQLQTQNGMDMLPAEILWIVVHSSGLSVSDTARLALATNREIWALHDDHVDAWLAAAVCRTPEWIRRHQVVQYARSRWWDYAWWGRPRQGPEPTRQRLQESLAMYVPRIERAVLSEEAVAEFVELRWDRSRCIVEDMATGQGNLCDQLRALERPGELILVDWEGDPPELVIGGMRAGTPRNMPIASVLMYHDVKRVAGDDSRRRMRLTIISKTTIAELEGHVIQRLADAGLTLDQYDGHRWHWRSGKWNIGVCRMGMFAQTYSY